MAGIGEYYYVGGSGGFLGSDGLNSLDFIVEVWHSDVMSLKVDYKTYNFKPMSISLKGFVPCGPNDPNQNLTMMILFASNLFESCPSYQKVKDECDGVSYINFSYDFNVPKHFNDLLNEAKQIDISDKVSIYYANLKEIKI